MLEKEMQNSMKEAEKQRRNKLNVQLFINGQKINPQSNQQIQEIKKPKQELSKEKAKQFAKFPKVEPKSEVRRLSGRIIYNIHVPGVENLNDIFINKLENSIEVKALGKDKVYAKILKLNLPLMGYNLINENIILELGER